MSRLWMNARRRSRLNLSSFQCRWSYDSRRDRLLHNYTVLELNNVRAKPTNVVCVALVCEQVISYINY
jgi:hypothetical protein